MQKQDLKNFDIVETRFGNLFMVCADKCVLFGEEGWLNFDDYDDDLNCLDHDEDYGIVKIRRPDLKSHYWPCGQTVAPIIWERKKKPKLSHDEKVILRALNRPDWWIARDSYGLCLYKENPVFETEWWGGEVGTMDLYDHLFDFVEKDKDCYQVKDLLGDGENT